MKTLTFFLLVGMTALLFSGCVTELTLLPRPNAVGRTDHEAFCNIDGNDLVIRIQNSGAKDAPPTTVLVEFPGFPSQTVVTPAIPKQSVVEVKVPIPAGCHNPDCDFKITVDPNNQVQEPREDNNVQAGICIG
jgi:hypothetical protein